jgi:gentisate 1,2-dioxygenase
MATTRFHDESPDVDGLYADLAAADLQPLWVQPGLLTPAPGRLRPHIWRWKTLRDLAERSGDLVGIERGGDRRVLSLTHPDLGGLPFATPTLWAAVQFLGAGELAPAHRHTPAALRFVLEGSGVWTLVNGDPIHMAPGDLVLTPSWTWHEHHNPGAGPMIWFDGLDLPLVQSLDAIFFEPGGEELTSYEAGRPLSRTPHRAGRPGCSPTAGRPPTPPCPG